MSADNSLNGIIWRDAIRLEGLDGETRVHHFVVTIPESESVDSLDDLVAHLNINPRLPDPRAEHHHRLIRLEVWFKAHILRLMYGWENSSPLNEHLEEHPGTATKLGFVEIGEDGSQQPRPPGQPQLWTIWNEKFPPGFQDASERIAEALVELARDHGIPAPAEVFQPEDRSDVGPRSERRYWKQEVKEVWQESKPIFEEHIKFLRGTNAQIPRSAFLAQHAQVGAKQDQCIEDGHDSFVEDSTRDEEDVPVGSHHRLTIRSRSIKRMREQHHSLLEELLRIASGVDGLPSELPLAIDITPGFQWHGQIERDADGNLADPYILGTKEGNLARKYATIQIITPEMPFILDCIPVTRGMPRAQIVDELLDTATDLLGHYGIDIVVMDRAFDGEAVKDVHEDYGVYYFNTRRRFPDEQTTIERMKLTGLTALTKVNERTEDRSPKRVQLYLPIQTDGDDDSEEESATVEDHDRSQPLDPLSVNQQLEDSAETEFGFGLQYWDAPDTSTSQPDDSRPLREQMAEEFDVSLNDQSEEDGGHPFEDLIESMRDDTHGGRRHRPSTSVDFEEESDDDQHQEYIVFETNHPYVTERVDETVEQAELAHLAARASRRFYRRRDRIEKGYQDLKPFMVRTTSDCPRYRFFCFHFASLMYNIWRIADLLAKLAADREADPTDGPKITQHTFFSIMNNQLDGLDPPD